MRSFLDTPTARRGTIDVMYVCVGSVYTRICYVMFCSVTVARLDSD